MKLLTYALFALAMTFGTSCKKFLEEKPNAKLSTPTTAMNLQALLDHSTTMNDRTPSFDEVSADDYFLTQANYNSLGAGGRTAYLWQPFIRNNESGWRNLSQAIYFTNICLENAAKIKRTPSNQKILDNVIGTAHFFRAFHLLKLVSTYCIAYDVQTASKDLGLILRLSSDFNVPSQRSTLAESYQQIIDDFEKALSYLPVKSESLLRPSIAATHAGLARTYLFMRNYEKASHHATQGLNLQNTLIDFNTVNVNANFPIQKLNNEVLFHSEVSVYSFVNLPNSALVDTNLYKSYSANDLRKVAYFASSGQYYRFKGSYSASNSLFNGLTTTELFLTKAECLIRAGHILEGLNILNDLLIKRWKKNTVYEDYSTTDYMTALNWIITERRKELVFRGLRWMDIKRLNKENFNIDIIRNIDNEKYVLVANSEKFALPLPTDIITLTGVNQNPGW